MTSSSRSSAAFTPRPAATLGPIGARQHRLHVAAVADGHHEFLIGDEILE